MNERQEPRAFLRVLTWPSREAGTPIVSRRMHVRVHVSRIVTRAEANTWRVYTQGRRVRVAAQRRLRERWLNIKEGKK